MRILAFSGKAMHGKDTCAQIAAEILRDGFGLNYARFAFAWPLKARAYAEGVCAGTGITWADIQTKPPHVRKLLQEVGTEKGRKVFGTEFWTTQADAFINLMMETDPTLDGVIISDARFPNEIDFVRKHGMAVWIASDRPTLTGEAALHPSETALDNVDKTTGFDAIVSNHMHDSLDSLRQQIAQILLPPLLPNFGAHR